VKEDLWQGWVNRYVNTEDPTPLFEMDSNLRVQFKNYGQNDRRTLKRSQEMEDRVWSEGRKVINDWETTDDTYKGLIYLMYWLEDGNVIPLYVGKAGKYGRDGESLSANLRGLRGTSTGKFARWGDGHYYHIGNLSAVVFDHDKNQKQKYEKWDDRLFKEGNRLRQPTYFWAKAWRRDDVGPFHNADVTLKELEGQLIELTSDLYHDLLLNTAGTGVK
jgi:hypothetical protein